MIGIILTLVIGLGIAYFSRFSGSGITLSVGSSTFVNIPLALLTVGTYMLGILLAWIIGIPDMIATAFEITGLGRAVRSGKNTIIELQNKISKLELENARLHGENQNSNNGIRTNENYRPNIFQNFLHRFNQR